MNLITFKTEKGKMSLKLNVNSFVTSVITPFNVNNNKVTADEDLSIEQKKIIKLFQDFFLGKKVNLSEIKVDLEGCTGFQKKTYNKLMTIKYGSLISYKDLGILMNKPGSERAIGTAMKKNPCPLIIPCHRVIKNDGQLGFFTSPGGQKDKHYLLKLEKSIELSNLH